MSNFTKHSTITNAGFDLQMRAQAGEIKLQFCKMLIGDGILAQGQELETLTNLIHPLHELPLEAGVRSGSSVRIRATMRNKNWLDEFYFREVGVFVKDPAGGADVLYMVSNTGITAQLMPPGTPGNDIIDEIFEFGIVIGKATGFTVILPEGSNGGSVSIVEFIDHKNDEHPHPNALKLGPAVTTCNSIIVQQSDPKTINPMSVDDAKRLILGGDASTLPVLAAQNDALFREVANIALFMQASQTYPDYNKLIAENFTPVTEVDITSITITSIAAGSNSIGVATLNGLVEGAWYNVSDGVLQELVQCTGLTQNGSTLRMQTAQPVVNTYNMATAMLYRSTTMIQTGQVGQLWSGQAQGAGNQTSSTWQPTLTWTGTAANAPVAAALITTQANAASFTLSGNAGFDANGNATLV